ncbi:MAG: TlpA disulfide reductase family protein [Planctomycetaceae bacterium]|nr:TlpA disulfide reductase family protein [Planctomycetaceae bacterium]
MPASKIDICASALIALALMGCGQTASETATAPASATPSESAAPGEAADIQVSAAGGQSTGDPPGQLADAAADAEPAEGTPEWNLREITRIRLLPLPEMTQPKDDDLDSDSVDSDPTVSQTSAAADAADTNVADAAAATSDPNAVKTVLNQTRAIRRERNQQIVTLAMTTLSQTAKDPEKTDTFNAAVHHFLDAHLQLALQGDEESIAALYEAAEAFHQKKPDSVAAAAAELTLVNLAHANALRYATSEPRWLQEFSRHSQLFATRFPNESSKALPQLLSAGRSCELHGQLDEAKSCYQLIQTKFPESPQAKQAEGILRRLSLVGQRIEFAGPTVDGNFVNIEDHIGKTVVIVFWATHVKTFQETVGALQALTEKYKKYAHVLSVNLDTDVASIDTFLEQTNLNWPVIFHAEHDKRSWNNPLAAYYGVSNLPTIWIVDPTGVVAETDVTAETLEAKLRDVILKHRAAAASTGQNSVESPKSP